MMKILLNILIFTAINSIVATAFAFPQEINLSDLNGNNGFVINGVAAEDLSGSSISSAGDVNGDGLMT